MKRQNGMNHWERWHFRSHGGQRSSSVVELLISQDIRRALRGKRRRPGEHFEWKTDGNSNLICFDLSPLFYFTGWKKRKKKQRSLSDSHFHNPRVTFPCLTDSLSPTQLPSRVTRTRSQHIWQLRATLAAPALLTAASWLASQRLWMAAIQVGGVSRPHNGIRLSDWKLLIQSPSPLKVSRLKVEVVWRPKRKKQQKKNVPPESTTFHFLPRLADWKRHFGFVLRRL